MALETPAGQPGPMQDGEFTSMSRPARVSWNLDKLTPPTPLYIARDDVLSVTAISPNGTTVIQVSGRILTVDSVVLPFVFTTPPLASNVHVLQSFPLSEGFLLSLSVICVAGTATDPVFARVSICRGPATIPNALSVLVAGYTNINTPISWPSTQPIEPEEGMGAMLAVQVANPAAGTDWTFTAGQQHRTTIIAAHATLSTSATVANRGVQAVISDNAGHVLWQGPPTAVIAASTSASVSFCSVSSSSTAIAANIVVSLPEPAVLVSQWTFGVVTAGLQAGDQWSNISLQVLDGFTNTV